MKKLLLAASVAALTSSLFAVDVGNLSEVNPKAYSRFVPTYGASYVGKNAMGDTAYEMNFKFKYSFTDTSDNDFYLKWGFDLGYLNGVKKPYASVGVALGDSFRLSKNNYLAIEGRYAYTAVVNGKSTTERPYYVKNWHRYGAAATYGYMLTDWLNIGAHAFFDINKYDFKNLNGNYDGKTFGAGIPITIGITKSVNLNLYGGYQKDKFDHNAIPSKNQAVGSISLSARF